MDLIYDGPTHRWLHIFYILHSPIWHLLLLDKFERPGSIETCCIVIERPGPSENR